MAKVGFGLHILYRNRGSMSGIRFSVFGFQLMFSIACVLSSIVPPHSDWCWGFRDWDFFSFPFENPPQSQSNNGTDMDSFREMPMTLDRLVHMHLKDALQLAVRLSGRADSAEEIVQEALLRVAKSWKTFRGEAEFRTWLFRIVINVFRDWLKRRESSASLDGLEESLPDRKADQPDSAMLRKEFQTIVAERVSALPPRQREVLVLMTYEELTAAQTALVLDISEANVHSTLHVARERLRRELAPYLVEK
jgi:RNA polymerase sigma-70 factor (ECF subfamily)